MWSDRMELISTREFIKNLPIESKSEGTYLNIVEENCILQGELDIPQTDWTVYKSHKFGGTIVNFKNDICIANFKKNYFTYGQEILALLRDYLRERGVNVQVDGNDLIADGKYKVASYASTNLDGIVYTAVHISMSVDLEPIKYHCIKPMTKIPKGLGEYKISTKELRDFFMGK